MKSQIVTIWVYIITQVIFVIIKIERILRSSLTRLQKIMQLLTAMIYHVAFEHFFSTTIPAFLQFEWKIVGYREIALTTCP